VRSGIGQTPSDALLDGRTVRRTRAATGAQDGREQPEDVFGARDWIRLERRIITAGQGIVGVRRPASDVGGALLAQPACLPATTPGPSSSVPGGQREGERIPPSGNPCVKGAAPVKREANVWGSPLRCGTAYVLPRSGANARRKR